jgi:hypothetical protein
MIRPQEQVPGDAEKLGGIRKADVAQLALRLTIRRKVILL